VKKVILLTMSIFILSGCVTLVAVNETSFRNIAVKDKAYKQSNFLTIDACHFAYAFGTEQTAKFSKANCALTDKQLIVYSATKSGMLLKKLVYLDYNNIKGVCFPKLSRGGQVQLKTNKGVIALTVGGKNIQDLGLNEKYYKIIKQHRVKDFKSPYMIFSPPEPVVIVMPVM